MNIEITENAKDYLAKKNKNTIVTFILQKWIFISIY